jgi:hypothetical protein
MPDALYAGMTLTVHGTITESAIFDRSKRSGTHQWCNQITVRVDATVPPALAAHLPLLELEDIVRVARKDDVRFAPGDRVTATLDIAGDPDQPHSYHLHHTQRL